MPPEHGARSGGDDGRGQSLAHHVGDRHLDGAVVEHLVVVEVTADLAGWPAASGELEAGDVRDGAGEQPALHLAGLQDFVVEGQLVLHPAAQRAQQPALGRAQLARLVVDDAQGSHRLAVGLHRLAGVEADVRVAPDVRVVGEPRIGPGVLDEQLAVPLDGLGGEGVPARHHVLEADAGLGELPVLLDEVDPDHGDAEDLPGELGDPVEALLGPGVELVEPADGLEPPLLLLWGHASASRDGRVQPRLANRPVVRAQAHVRTTPTTQVRAARNAKANSMRMPSPTARTACTVAGQARSWPSRRHSLR